MKRAPNSTIFAIMIACSLVFGIGINILAYSKDSTNRASLAAVQAEVDAVSKVPARLQDSQQKLRDAKAALKHLEQGVAASTYVPTLMRQLEDLGNSCGVEVTAVRPVPVVPSAPTAKDKPEAPKPYDTLDIEVRGLGRYADALRFVNSLDTFPKVVEARTVSLEPAPHAVDKAQAGSPRLSMSILMRAYLFKGDNRTAMADHKVKNAG